MNYTDTYDTLNTFVTELPHFFILVKVHVIAIHVAKCRPPEPKKSSPITHTELNETFIMMVRNDINYMSC